MLHSQKARLGLGDWMRQLEPSHALAALPGASYMEVTIA